MADVTGAVVAGYDGSAESGAAVDWAVGEASRRGRKLVVVQAATHVQSIISFGRSPGRVGASAEASRTLAEEGAGRARNAVSGVVIEAMTDHRGASAALTQLSEQASMIVVGNRGRGRVTGALLGSVAFAVATHAHTPTVVVRGVTTQPPSPSRPVVVGVDGSGNTALGHAADIAAEAGAELHVLVAWQGAAANPWSPADMRNVDANQDAAMDARQAATAVAEHAVEHASTRRADLAVTQPVVIEGRPEQVLAQASADAGLVVVGARGRGDLASLLLGSVSRAVIHGATCPVTIVR